MKDYPQLEQAKDQQRAFVCGYLAHLAMDVVWSDTMIFPYFYGAIWAAPRIRYNMVHVLLCYLDQRDYRQWAPNFADALKNTVPEDWLPFLAADEVKT